MLSLNIYIQIYCGYSIQWKKYKGIYTCIYLYIINTDALYM